MGTRSLTIIQEDGDDYVVMYRQMDGYPEGHGLELAHFLEGFNLVNGIGANTDKKIANGLGCLAAQVVAHFKEGVGGIYLYPSDTRDCGQDYNYIVSGVDGEISISIYETPYKGEPDCIFSGSPTLLINKYDKK